MMQVPDVPFPGPAVLVCKESSDYSGRSPRRSVTVPSTQAMERMLWRAACSLRGEKDAAKFKDYLLPLLFLKRLSDVFDDEVVQPGEISPSPDTALPGTTRGHPLSRFHLPPESRWEVISGQVSHDWPKDEQGRSTQPRDIGHHLNIALRAIARANASLSGVIDRIDFTSEHNGERDVNPAKLQDILKTLSHPCYRLGLRDVQPDFLGRAYEYLLRKFAEGSGQSAGEFFTPTEVGFLMALIMRPKPGEECHDYACGSAGLLIKLQLIARELHPENATPLNLYGQELTAESYAIARMNAIIHDMNVEMAHGDTMIHPRFKISDTRIRSYDIVIANPMWNQHFNPDVLANDPFGRFRTTGGLTSGKGDWAWLQHTLACLNDRGRAAVVLDVGAVTRGSEGRNNNKERSIRKWFVDHDLIDGVILLPDNLFYNTTAPSVIIVLSRCKPPQRKDKIFLLDATHRVRKGRPKNFIPEDDIRPLAAAYLKGAPIKGELAVITRQQAAKADYNLSPRRWVHRPVFQDQTPIADLLNALSTLDVTARDLENRLSNLLAPLGKRS